MSEKLSQDCILAEFGFTPIWLPKIDKKEFDSPIYCLNFSFVKKKIFFLTSASHEGEQEKKLFESIAEYLNSITDQLASTEILTSDQMNNLLQTQEPDFIFCFGEMATQNIFSSATCFNSSINLSDMIKDAGKKKIFWHDIRSFLTLIKKDN